MENDAVEEDEESESEDRASGGPTSSGTSRPPSIGSIPSENDRADKLQNIGNLLNDGDDEGDASTGKKAESMENKKRAQPKKPFTNFIR